MRLNPHFIMRRALMGARLPRLFTSYLDLYLNNGRLTYTCTMTETVSSLADFATNWGSIWNFSFLNHQYIDNHSTWRAQISPRSVCWISFNITAYCLYRFHSAFWMFYTGCNSLVKSFGVSAQNLWVSASCLHPIPFIRGYGPYIHSIDLDGCMYGQLRYTRKWDAYFVNEGWYSLSRV